MSIGAPPPPTPASPRRLRTRPPRGRRPLWLLAVCLLALVAAAGTWIWTGVWTPTAVWSRDGQPVLVFEGRRLEEAPRVEDGQVLMPFTAFQAEIDPQALWDREAGLLILTTANRILVFPEDAVAAFVNEEPVHLSVPLRVWDGQAYVPLAPLAELYGLDALYDPGSKTAIVDRVSTPVLRARTSARLWMRTSPARFAARLADVPAGAVVRVFSEDRGFYLARLVDGRLGFLPKEGVRIEDVVAGASPSPAAPEPLPGKPDWPLNLTWDTVGRAPADPSRYPDMPGLNVISPTWFHLGEDGLVTSRADPAYVHKAHARGFAVWPLFGNQFDPDLTHEVLADSRLRLGITRQLLVQARIAGFDGINVDWENMNPADRDLFSQFVRELSPLAHRAGLAVSVDVTFPGPSAYWQQCYDRAALGQVADYIVAMGYDQFTEESGAPGPVSSFPWVQAGITSTLKEVPARKLVLGVPFYTRIWSRKGGTLDTRALGMAEAEAYLARRDATTAFDAIHGLPVVRWLEGQTEYTMWAETPDTLRRRARLARDGGLAGVASWQRRFAGRAAWEALDSGLRGR